MKPRTSDGPRVGSTTGQLPPLFVDVDGVISLFGFQEPYGLGSGDVLFTGRPEGVFRWVNGVPHYISAGAGGYLRALATQFDLVWASGWEETANEYLPHFLDLPAELPYLSFDGRVAIGAAHWKIEAIEEYAGPHRALAWIDDNLDESCHVWAANRPGRSLLIETERHIGMHDDHVEELLAFARSVGAPDFSG